MKIQGMGYYDSKLMNGKLNTELISFPQQKNKNIEKPGSVEQLGEEIKINGQELGSKDLQNMEEIQEQRARAQELLQTQKRSMKLIKNLLFLITPGMGKLLDENSHSVSTEKAQA